MKTLDELGISPAPWEYSEEHNEVFCHLGNGIKYGIAVPAIHSDEETDANALLISAAPELYECMREAVEQTCLYCQYKNMCKECKVVNKWRSALAKAAGEEAK